MNEPYGIGTTVQSRAIDLALTRLASTIRYCVNVLNDQPRRGSVDLDLTAKIMLGGQAKRFDEQAG